MAFTSGRRKTGGRNKGTPNKLRFTGDSRAFWQQYLESPRYREAMVRLIERGHANPIVVHLHNMLYGKPVSVVELRKVTDTREPGLSLEKQRELIFALEESNPAKFVEMLRESGIPVPLRLQQRAGLITEEGRVAAVRAGRIFEEPARTTSTELER